MATTTADPQANGHAEQQETRPPYSAPAPPLRGADILDRIVSEDRVAERDGIILQRAKLDYKQRLAKMFANSGCFVDIDKDVDGKFLPEDVSIARAMVKIELGESMNFSPAEAMTGIDIIKGRVAVGANLRAARMQRAGYSWPSMACTDKGCWIPLEFQGKPLMQMKVTEDGEPVLVNGKPAMVQVVVSFTEKDASRAGLSGKDNYKKDPSSMYFARAITRAQRRYGPGVLGVDVLDTYEAAELPEKVPGPALDLASFMPSAEANRGHDNAAPAARSATSAAAPEAPTSTAATGKDLF